MLPLEYSPYLQNARSRRLIELAATGCHGSCPLDMGANPWETIREYEKSAWSATSQVLRPDA